MDESEDIYDELGKRPGFIFDLEGRHAAAILQWREEQEDIRHRDDIWRQVDIMRLNTAYQPFILWTPIP